MPKEPHKDRDKVIEEIDLRRQASFENPNDLKDEKQRDESPRQFIYTDKQRALIASELRTDGGVDAETIDTIEMIVRLTAESLQCRAECQISPEQEKKFRNLRKPIAQILGILEHPEFGHLEEYVPHMREELHLLGAMVDSDQRQGRGRPPDPCNVHLKNLVTRLATLWTEHRGRPKRWYRDDRP